jgi:signal transduction histidine kinase
VNAAGFWRGALAALVLSTAGALAFKAVAPLAGSGLGLKLLTLGLSAAYLLWLLARHEARAGRIASATAWCLAAALLLAVDPALWTWLFVQAGLIWLLRCLHVHDRLRGALLDAGLNGLALAAALATAAHTRSLFLSLWCFFLVQALYVLIPGTATRASPAGDRDAFEHAERAAEAALRRLATRS